jgi:hypothetical protein
VPFKIGKHTVAPFLVKRRKLALEKCLEIHVTLQNLLRFSVQAASASTPGLLNRNHLRQKARIF